LETSLPFNIANGKDINYLKEEEFLIATSSQTEMYLMTNKLLMLIMVNMLLLMIMVSPMSGNTKETSPAKPKESVSSKEKTETFTATKSPTEINLTIRNSKIKMMLTMISLITTDLSTNGKTKVMLLKSEPPDHHSTLPRFKT